MKVSKLPEIIMNVVRKTKNNYFYLLFPSPHNFLHSLTKRGPKFNLNEILKKKKYEGKTSTPASATLICFLTCSLLHILPLDIYIPLIEAPWGPCSCFGAMDVVYSLLY